MARFFGKVGYETTKETAPGVWSTETTVRSYYGSVLHNTTRMREAGVINSKITVSHNIEVVADAYALDNFQDIRWVEWNGVKWSVITVENWRPRIKLWLGDRYNVED